MSHCDLSQVCWSRDKAEQAEQWDHGTEYGLKYIFLINKIYPRYICRFIISAWLTNAQFANAGKLIIAFFKTWKSTLVCICYTVGHKTRTKAKKKKRKKIYDNYLPLCSLSLKKVSRLILSHCVLQLWSKVFRIYVFFLSLKLAHEWLHVCWHGSSSAFEQAFCPVKISTKSLQRNVFLHSLHVSHIKNESDHLHFSSSHKNTFEVSI